MPEAHEGETDDLLDNIDKIKRNQHDTNKMDGVLVQNIPASPPEMPNHVRNRPPPVPNRPVSYTPSAADSLNTLNNCAFDTARNYGSNGDDLENIGTLREPIEIPDFLRNAEVEKSPVPGRALPPPPPDEEPLLKPTDWHSNNMNSPLGKFSTVSVQLCDTVDDSVFSRLHTRYLCLLVSDILTCMIP